MFLAGFRHLLAAQVQFLTEMLLVEVLDLPVTRVRNPNLYDVPLLTFMPPTDEEWG